MTVVVAHKPHFAPGGEGPRGCPAGVPCCYFTTQGLALPVPDDMQCIHLECVLVSTECSMSAPTPVSFMECLVG